jgi:hypothetical protein
MNIIDFDKNRIMKDITKIKYLLTTKEYETIMSLINYINSPLNIDINEMQIIQASNPKKYKPELSNWLYINDFFYNKMIIRWMPKDILKGSKMHNDMIFKLENTIRHGMTKIDLIYTDLGKYIEVSNTFFFKINGKLNMDDNINDLIKELKIEAFNKFYNRAGNNLNIFKGFKLIYSICKITKNKEYILKFNYMLNSDLGAIGKIISELKSCKDVIKYSSNNNVVPDLKIITSVIESISDRLNKIVDFEIKDPILFENIISLFNSYTNRQYKLIVPEESVSDLLTILIIELQNILNKETVIYAYKHKLFPLNPLFLP